MNKRSRSSAKKIFNILNLFLILFLIIPPWVSPNLINAVQAQEDVLETQNDPVEVEEVTVCHNGESTQINKDDLSLHLEHGDYEGECNDEDQNNEEINITNNTNETQEIEEPSLKVSTPPEDRGVCPFDEEDGIVVYFDTNGKSILSRYTIEDATKASLPFDVIPSGTYKITLVGYDPSHPDPLQPKEEWQLLLKDLDGNVFATTSPTQDIDDNLISRIDVVENEMNIPKDVYAIDARHAAFLDTSNANSVDPICALFEPKTDNDGGDDNFPVCGNNILEEGEMCDDGNNLNGDGCNNICEFESLSCENVDGEGWYAEYFNYNAEHPDMQLNAVSWPDDNHGDPLSSENNWDTDWYNDEYLKFSRVDSNLKFGEDFFPFDSSKQETHNGGSDNGQHEFHFGAHWRALVTGNGVYEYNLKSDDDAWVYVDGVLIASLPGIHPPTSLNATTTLDGKHVVDIFFAERHTKRSHFSFEFKNDGNPLTITPLPGKCQPSIKVCKYIDNEGNGASEDDSLYGSGWSFSLLESGDNQTYNVDEYKNTDDSSCVYYENLLPGEYKILEKELNNWVNTDIQVIKNDSEQNNAEIEDGMLNTSIGLGDELLVNYYNYNVKYCGDGIVNQEWEACDGGEQCTDTCQLENDTMCHDLVLAQINVENIVNKGTGSTTSDIYLGSKLNKIPEGTWFALFNNGSFITDQDISLYEDVDGLAVERKDGKLRVVMHGSKGRKDIEHTEGNIVLYNADVTGLSSDNSKGLGASNRLEAGFDGTGIGDLSPANDEVSTSTNNIVDYYITTNVADDGFIVDWEIVENCIGICGIKFNDINENTEMDEGEPALEGWEFNLYEKNQCRADEHWADKVVSFTQGNDSNGSPVSVERSDATKALGQAEGDDTLNFVSLGIGGELVLYFENLIENGPGDDIEVTETTFNNPQCGEYPEYVEVYASQTGLDGSWVKLGMAKCLDSTFDLGTLPWAQYVKLVDKTNSDLFGDKVVDGYDVDAVRAIHCKSLSGPIDTQMSNQNGEFCFVGGLEEGEYHVSESLKNGWKNTTPIAQQVKFDGENRIDILFGNAKLPVVPGEIHGLKYHDLNKNGERDEGEPGLEGWEIQLFQYPNAPWKDAPENTPLQTATTDKDGMYWFTDLEPGVYQVFEVQKDGWTQTEPSLTDDGGLHKPEEGGNVLPLSLFPLNTPISLTDTDPETNEGKFLEAKFAKNPTMMKILGNSFDCVFRHWNDMENCVSSEDLINLKYYTIYLEGGSIIDEAVFGNVEGELSTCEDGIDNEEDGFIDADDPDCHTDKDPTNAESYDPSKEETNDDSIQEESLIIINEDVSTSTPESAVLIWTTNIPATSRIVYGTTSVPEIGSPPNYGYDFSTPEDTSTTTNHTVELSGLQPNTTYFWRAVSRENTSTTTEAVGIEKSFTTPYDDQNNNDDNGGDDNGGSGGGGEGGNTGSGSGGGGGTVLGNSPLSYGVGGGAGSYIQTTTFVPVSATTSTTSPVTGTTSQPSLIGESSGQSGEGQTQQGGSTATQEAPNTTTGTTTNESEETTEEESNNINQTAGLAFLGINYSCPWWVSLLALIVVVVASFYAYKKKNNILIALAVLVAGIIISLLFGSYDCLWLLGFLAIVVLVLIGMILRENKNKVTQ